MDKIRNYIDELFINSPKNKKIRELKEELLLDLEEKYNDLIKDGKKETEAYNEVIAGIGDIDELIHINDNLDDIEESRKKHALLVSICVGIYILAFIVAIILDEVIHVSDAITGVSFFTLCGLATCILVYSSMSKPKYIKQDDTMVEEFKEWKSTKNNNKAIRKSISSIVWTLILAIYFIVSFATMAWYITWVLFIIGWLIESIVDLIFSVKE